MGNTTMVLYDVASKLRRCVMPTWTTTLHYHYSDRWLISKLLFQNFKLKLTWYIFVIILANCDMITQTKFWCGLYKLRRINSVNFFIGTLVMGRINRRRLIAAVVTGLFVCIWLNLNWFNIIGEFRRCYCFQTLNLQTSWIECPSIAKLGRIK